MSQAARYRGTEEMNKERLMDPLESVCRAIHARDGHVRSLEKAKNASGMLPWYRFGERSRLRAEIASLHSLIAVANEQVGPDGVLRLANRAGARLWHQAAETVIPNKNPYGRAAQEHFDAILEPALDGRDDLVLFHMHPRTSRLSSLPDVAEHLTGSFIESNVRDIIAERAAVAASPVFAHELYQNRDNQPAMIVQHIASGLRAMFTEVRPGMGAVFSKPYNIRSIDPENPGTAVQWESYVGLGIGERIYAEAHRLEPEVRWMSGASSPYSTRLREKLHAANPYIWSGSCHWCEQKLVQLGIYSWDAADKKFFNDHP
ncbi:UNVERIFIED_ORG: hypothetical protein ABIB52_000802 [Arthrobacter sp. UYCu721]